jgi:hypothetical protein
MKRDSIKPLAVEGLDIEELERRTELAPLAAVQGWECTVDCESLNQTSR